MRTPRNRASTLESAALHRAVRMLRTAELPAAYEAAWEEWAAEGDDKRWEPTSGDGLES